MGDRRKLNSEIDRCLKKVNEGVETFDDVWQKVQSTSNSNQKERHEQELKKEIKKLQRLRDQIKGWIASPEIKDKTSLQDSRKLIEQQMERFKAVERETKTKAYSNGGLVAPHRIDPQEKEKESCMEWIEEAIRELELQRDKFESDIELLSATMKKKKSERDKLERLDELKRWLGKHNYHISSLQKILRAIDNEAVDLKEVQDLRTDIDYYVRSNQDPDFKENDMMYEGIDMDNIRTIMGPGLATPNQPHPAPTFTTNQASNISTGNFSTHTDPNLPVTTNVSSILQPTERFLPTTLTSNLTSAENVSVVGLTTNSSLVQPTSPIASPALTVMEEPKKTKTEPGENSTQRHRSNSGVNPLSGSNISNLTSPKISSTLQQSPGVQSTTRNPLLFSATVSSSSASPHLAHSVSSPPSTTTAPTTTSNATTMVQPVLPYAAIVSQSTPSGSSASSGHTNAKQQSNVLSPTSKPNPGPSSINNNDSTVMNYSNMSIPSTSSSSSSSSLLTTNPDRNLAGNHSHSATTLSNVTAHNGPAVTSSSYSILPLSMNNSNNPHESSLNNNFELAMGTQKPAHINRSISETERNNNPNGMTTSAVPSNGNSDAHGPIDKNTFSNILSAPTSALNSQNPTAMSPAFFSTQNLNDLQPNTNGATMGSISEHPNARYSTNPLNNQTSILNNRVPLSNSEIRTLHRLNSAFTKLPSLLESERQRANANRIYARNPLSTSQTIPYYPQVPPASSDAPEFYYRLAPETLFFVFYYMEGTRAQYLAAKALKRQSWRFHTKHMMWFQRHEEPKAITDDYEQGTYIYFDYERWQARKSENFMFEYKFLEDREY